VDTSPLDSTFVCNTPEDALKGLPFEVSVCPPDLVVRADRRALIQILFNLTSNAIKFTEKAQVRPRVGRHRKSGLLLSEFIVSDTGIRPDDRARLFQAFTQVDGSRTHRSEGTGLGLHLSQKLADAGRADRLPERIRHGQHVYPGFYGGQVVSARSHQQRQPREPRTELRAIPFVHITSIMLEEKDRAKGLALGADKFLIRSIEPELFLSEVKACCRAEAPS
jgi:hypothetical protein